MDKVSFLLWYSNLAIGDQDNALVADFLSKACKLIEQEINQEGGFAGAEFNIRFEHVAGTKTDAVNNLLRIVEDSPDIGITHSSPFAASHKLLMESPAFSELMAFYSGASVELQANHHVNISRVSKLAKVKAANHLLHKYSDVSRYFFLHDGKRIVELESELLSELPDRCVSIDFGSLNEPSEIDTKLDWFFSEIDDDCVLILDIGLSKFKQVFDHLNGVKKPGKVLSLFGSLEGRFDEIGFPLTQVTTEYAFHTLAFEDLIRRVGIPLSPTEKALVLDSSWRLELPLLAAQASQYMEKNISDKKTLVKGLSKAIGKIDGVRDIFVGKRLKYAFREQENILRETYSYQFPASLQTKGSYPKLLCPEQISSANNAISIVAVNYFYVNILRITNIDIGEGTWTAEFYLDVVSRYENPIDILKFNNLSSIKPKFEVKLLWSKSDLGKEETSYRYYCVGNFDFVPDPDNYPFDWQYVFLSLSIADEEQHGVLQPVPGVLLDTTFKINGWSVQDGVTGVRRRKATAYEGSDLSTRVRINEESRIGWILSRENTFAIVKVGVPLFFLVFLVYYTLFLPITDSGSSIGILTTAFLSGIALYFSSERPEPRRITNIDVIFLWYYLVTGICMVGIVGTMLFGESIYTQVTSLLRIAVPAGLVGLGVYLKNRIRSNPSRISVSQDI